MNSEGENGFHDAILRHSGAEMIQNLIMEHLLIFVVPILLKQYLWNFVQVYWVAIDFCSQVCMSVQIFFTLIRANSRAMIRVCI